MRLSPLIEVVRRVAPPQLAFQIELWRLRRWRATEPEWLLVDELVDRRRAAVDAGANYGLYAGRLAALCPRVICIEPQPALAEKLRQKLSPRRAVVHQAALSDRPGVARLYLHEDDALASLEPTPGGRHLAEIEVPLARLDDLVTEPVGFVKLDVEGHELAALRGAERILTQDRPKLLVETQAQNRAEAPFDVFRHMDAHGYRGWFLWQGDRVPVERFDLDLHHDLPGRLEKGGFANNFIFEPRG